MYALLVSTGVLLVESMSWICMLMGGHIVVCAGNVHMSGVKNVTLVCWVSYI